VGWGRGLRRPDGIDARVRRKQAPVGVIPRQKYALAFREYFRAAAVDVVESKY
jgi:hypothetical protein